MKRLTIILLALAAAGCGQKQTGELPVIDIAGSLGTYRQIPMSEYIDQIEYIPLETHPDALFGEHRHVVVTPTRIFVASVGYCYAFTREGEFVANIGRRGRGPGEYSVLTGISVDETNELIYLDAFPDMLVYTWDGRLVRTIAKPVLDEMYGSRGDLFFLREGRLLGYIDNSSGQQPHNWIVTDDAGTRIREFPQHIRIDKEREFTGGGILRASPPFISSGEAWFSEHINDTIFHLTLRDELLPKFVFNLGRYAYRRDAYLDRNTMYDLARATIFANSGDPMIMTDDHIFFASNVGPDLFPLIPAGVKETRPTFDGGPTMDYDDTMILLGIYDIRRDRTELLDRDPVTRRKGLVNDLDGGLSFWPEYGSGGEMAQVLSAFDMKNLLTEEYFAAHPARDPAAQARLRTLLQNLDETDNPVIAIAKPK